MHDGPQSTGELVSGAILITVLALISGWAAWRRARPQHLLDKASFELAQQRWRLDITPDGGRHLVNQLDDPARDVSVATSSPRHSPLLIVLGRREDDARPLADHHADQVQPGATLDLHLDLSHRRDTWVEVEWTQPNGDPAWARLRNRPTQ